jgi:F5/8 type C domain-containing protein
MKLRSRQARQVLTWLACLSTLLAFVSTFLKTARTQSSRPITVVKIFFKPGHPLNQFDSSYALGAAIDGHEKGELDHMLSRENVSKMLSAGLKPISYRLRTELAGEGWHWNPKGSWTEANRGYWISNDKPDLSELSLSYGYRLPRRGNTFDQANDDDYSRLDDGDSRTFWKSNPYLDRHFTGQPNATLPQWIVIDLGKKKFINVIRLNWAEPFATVYDVQFGDFSGIDDISQSLPDQWRTFPKGEIRTQHGGNVEIRLSTEPVPTRFVRVLMKESSERSNFKSRDIRVHVGYAVREIFVGTLDNEHHFHDEISHAPDNAVQTPIYVSSTDPWHRSKDKDSMIEQAGFDRIFKSGLTNQMPMLTPVALLYDTPENAAAELRYLKARGYPVSRMELGEEPDGQFTTPEDYGALYIQFARALHAVDPNIKLGGPSFQDIAEGKGDWLRRFVTYLSRQGHIDDYTFSSFEWYPFDDVCQQTGPQLKESTRLLTESLRAMRRADSREGVPWIMTEYGYSVFGGRPEIDIEGALLNADAVANFLTLGGEQTFLYGYEPNELLQEVKCSQGNNMLFLFGNDGRISSQMPTYYAAQLLTHEWTNPGGGLHELYQATTDDPLITAYATMRPDRLWAVLLINKDPDNAREVKIEFECEEPGCEDLKIGYSHGEVDFYQYSSDEYQLGADFRAVRDRPPEHQRLKFSAGTTFKIPAYSLSVLRG